MVSQVYKEYLNKVDSCLGVNTNPKLRDDIVRYLNYILDDYRKIEYDREHYEAMYEKFLNTVVSQAISGDYDGLSFSYFDVFGSEYQKKLTDFSETMDVIANIHVNSTFEIIKATAFKLYGWVYKATDLPLETIDSYKEKFETFIDCLTEIESFVNQSVYYNVDYFTSYINKIIDDLVHYACMFELENVKNKIEEVNDSNLNNALSNLSNVLDKLKVIKEGADDYSFIDKIDCLLEEVKEECYLSAYALKDFTERSNDLIYEFRYG